MSHETSRSASSGRWAEVERRRGIRIRHQLRDLSPLALVWLFGAVLLLFVGVQGSDMSEELFLDPSTVAGRPWYSGLMSQLGILCWAVAVTAALGASWVAFQTQRPSAGRFLAAGGLATAVLLLDDLLQLHVTVPPRFGLDQNSAQLLIVVPVVMWLVVFARDLLRTRWSLLVAAQVAFAVSLAVDALIIQDPNLMVEDGAKFLGVLAWAQYFVMTAKDIARSTINGAGRTFVVPTVVDEVEWAKLDAELEADEGSTSKAGARL